MARNQPRPQAASELRLEPLDENCPICERRLWVAYHGVRTVATLSEVVRLRLVVRRCVNRECEIYHEARRPEQEGAFALPQGEFGLDVICLVGALRATLTIAASPRSTASCWVVALPSPRGR